jgi:hypothetical protein
MANSVPTEERLPPIGGPPSSISTLSSQNKLPLLSLNGATKAQALQRYAPEKDALFHDFTRSTEDNHQAASPEEGLFTGHFIEHRATLDYGYHRRYHQRRQRQQDEIVRYFLKTVVRDSSTNMYCDRPLHPWVVFTAGAMGAGKSRAMRWMHERGLFPLTSFVQVRSYKRFIAHP